MLIKPKSVYFEKPKILAKSDKYCKYNPILVEIANFLENLSTRKLKKGT